MRNLLTFFLLFSGVVWANEYIHGTVTLKSGEAHTGILRWDDDEESFWSDHFNGEKSEIPQFQTLSDDIKEAIEDSQKGPKLDLLSFQVTLSSIFADDLENPDFIVPFGAIAKLTTLRNEQGDDGLRISLHNGDSFESYDGSNDLDAEIFVKKASGATEQFKMRQVDHVVFSQTSQPFEGFNQGIYAVVDSELGTFKGRVFWDRDERFLNETIEGTEMSQPENGELSIPLVDIKSIEKKTMGSLLTQHSGKQLHLTGTNDVDDDNRGLYIDTPDRGRILLPWEQFKKMTIQDQPQHDWQAYHQGLNHKAVLSAEVELKNGSLVQANQMVFNMSQTSPAEIIRCTVKGMDLYMPLFLIKSIEPLSDQHAKVTLRNGEQLNMYDAASFTDENLGLLYEQGGNSQYIPWANVKKLVFNH